MPVAAVVPASTELLAHVERLEAEHEVLHALLSETRRANEVLGRIHAAIARLRTAGSAERIMALTPAEVCAACDLDRALVSWIDGSTWLPHRAHVADRGGDEKATEHELRGIRYPLASPLPEAEVARRRTPLLVAAPATDPRTHRKLVAATRTRGYVVAPIVADETVVGLLHADIHRTGRTLTATDRDNLRLFADGLGLVVEQATLAERLAGQRERIAAAFAQAEETLARLTVAPLPLGRTQPSPIPWSSRPGGRTALTDERFTDRQRQVLELIVGGATNTEIADRLTVAETTVKSHVTQILRKLGASNRAEAIARYLRQERDRMVPA